MPTLHIIGISSSFFLPTDSNRELQERSDDGRDIRGDKFTLSANPVDRVSRCLVCDLAQGRYMEVDPEFRRLFPEVSEDKKRATLYHGQMLISSSTAGHLEDVRMNLKEF